MDKKVKSHNLSVKGIDKEYFLNDPFYNEKGKKIDFKGIIKEYEISSDGKTDYISLASKFKPHSDYELMLQSTDNILKSSPSDISSKSLNKVLKIGYKFIEFLSDPNVIKKYGMNQGYAYMVYNYDKHTTDRHSGMSKKDFHLHLNSWQKDTLNKLKEIDIENTSSFYIKSIADPLFDIAQILIYDALDSDELSKYLKPANDINGEISYSGVYEIKNGWKSLNDENFAQLIQKIHDKLNERYAEILECFTGEKTVPERYTRHKLLPKAIIKSKIIATKMKESTKSVLLIKVDTLKSITPEQFEKIQQRPNFRDTLISLRWLAYSLAFFSNAYISEDSPMVNQKAYVNITPRLFTKIGGASILNMPGRELVKIDRGEGQVTDEEFEEKSNFHKDFTRTL